MTAMRTLSTMMKKSAWKRPTRGLAANWVNQASTVVGIGKAAKTAICMGMMTRVATAAQKASL